jgi:hypothetical protein
VRQAFGGDLYPFCGVIEAIRISASISNNHNEPKEMGSPE